MERSHRIGKIKLSERIGIWGLLWVDRGREKQQARQRITAMRTDQANMGRFGGWIAVVAFVEAVFSMVWG